MISLPDKTAGMAVVNVMFKLIQLSRKERSCLELCASLMVSIDVISYNTRKISIVGASLSKQLLWLHIKRLSFTLS